MRTSSHDSSIETDSQFLITGGAQKGGDDTGRPPWSLHQGWAILASRKHSSDWPGTTRLISDLLETELDMRRCLEGGWMAFSWLGPSRALYWETQDPVSHFVVPCLKSLDQRVGLGDLTVFPFRQYTK
jgi:hypothetical protein